MPPIDPGQYRQKLIYQEYQGAKNSVGQFVGGWVDVATVWSRVAPLSGREAFYARQINSLTTHEVKFRWRSGIKTVGRFIHAETGLVLHILGIVDFEMRRIELTAACVSRPASDPPTNP